VELRLRYPAGRQGVLGQSAQVRHDYFSQLPSVSDRTACRFDLAGPWLKLETSSLRSAQPAAREVFALVLVDNALPKPEGGGLLAELPFPFFDSFPFPARAGACTLVLQ
jgi:hypothetical protein